MGEKINRYLGERKSSQGERRERNSGGKGRGEDYVATHLSLLLFKCVTPSFFISFDGFHPKLRKGKI